MAGLKWRQQQKDSKSVAWGLNFEYLFQLLRCYRNLCKTAARSCQHPLK